MDDLADWATWVGETLGGGCERRGQSQSSTGHGGSSRSDKSNAYSPLDDLVQLAIRHGVGVLDKRALQIHCMKLHIAANALAGRIHFARGQHMK